MYANFFKRILDFFCALSAILCLSPLLLALTVLGAIKMKGNPFFTQLRPGKNEKIFKLIKFRSMTCEKDADGNLLPDEKRLTKYGKLLRSTSLDELPELFNILKGDMSVIGPRPLVPQYLPYYTEEEKHRHDVRPGLSGLAQINGRNTLNWEDRFAYDLKYVKNISFVLDVSIVLKTLLKVVKRSDIQVRGTTKMMDFDKYRIQQRDGKC
jgi:lipopolysaccharide/colanic/teichoic acid biosynthesis glycosyltransferase